MISLVKRKRLRSCSYFYSIHQHLHLLLEFFHQDQLLEFFHKDQFFHQDLLLKAAQHLITVVAIIVLQFGPSQWRNLQLRINLQLNRMQRFYFDLAPKLSAYHRYLNNLDFLTCWNLDSIKNLAVKMKNQIVDVSSFPFNSKRKSA